MPFFEFDQSNSGGSFDFQDKAISRFVIIEAENANEANSIAQSLGLYFDGAGDCSCCGYRWSSKWDDDEGTEEPTIHGQPISEYERGFLDFSWMAPNPEAFVHYLNGDIDSVYFDADSGVRIERTKVVQGKTVDAELVA